MRKLAFAALAAILVLFVSSPKVFGADLPEYLAYGLRVSFPDSWKAGKANGGKGWVERFFYVSADGHKDVIRFTCVRRSNFHSYPDINVWIQTAVQENLHKWYLEGWPDTNELWSRQESGRWVILSHKVLYGTILQGDPPTSRRHEHQGQQITLSYSVQNPGVDNEAWCWSLVGNVDRSGPVDVLTSQVILAISPLVVSSSQ